MSDADEYEEVEEIEEVEEEEEYEEYEETVEETDESEAASSSAHESQEEVEDQLKYERLKLDFLHVPGDAVSCMAVGCRFLVIGTQLGWVYVVDFVGNLVENRRYHRHKSSVSDISIDPECDYVASCSTDGGVFVGSIFDDSRSKDSYEAEFDRPVRAIAIDPNYAQTSRFITGGLERKLILIEKTWSVWKKHVWKAKNLDHDTGTIHAIKWRGDLVAWADDKGVKILDVKKDKKIVKVERERDAPHASMYRCSLVWESDSVLLIAWANWLVVCEIKSRSAYEIAHDHTLADRCGEVTARFIMPSYFVCGIAPFDKKLLMLTYPEDTLKKEIGTASPKPELRILNRANNKMNEIEKNCMKLAEYENNLASVYALVFDELEKSDRVYYVLSPKEIVVCKPCDVDDRINWLLKRNRFEEAMVATRQVTSFSPVSRHTYQAVGEKYLVHLVDTEQYTKAAELLPEVLGSNATLWKKWVYIFRDKEQLTYIASIIPTDPELHLGSEVYETALHFFLWQEGAGPAAFYRVIKEWPTELYSIEPIINSTRQRLADLVKPEVLDPPPTAGTTLQDAASPDSENDDPYTLLSLALALLYEKAHNKEASLHIHLELGRSDVFDFISRHNLYHAVERSVVPLLWKNQNRALKMLVEHHRIIKVSTVVHQLKNRKAYLYRYLSLLHKEDSRAGAEYHDTLVQLYAEFDSKQLLPFLRQASLDTFAGLDTATEVCKARLQCSTLSEEEKKALYRAQAFSLGRLGERRLALGILISKIKSVKESIDFILEHDDEELFEELVLACLEGGQAFVADLLEHIGDAEGPTRAIEPLDVINRIRPDMAIPGLKQKVTQILRDQALRKYLKDGCLRVLEKDACALESELCDKRARGCRVRVGGSNPCPGCNEPLRLRSNDPQGVVVFLCGHSYHHRCYHDLVGKKLPESTAARTNRRYPAMVRIDGVLVRTGIVSSESTMNDRNPHCPRCVSAR